MPKAQIDEKMTAQIERLLQATESGLIQWTEHSGGVLRCRSLDARLPRPVVDLIDNRGWCNVCCESAEPGEDGVCCTCGNRQSLGRLTLSVSWTGALNRERCEDVIEPEPLLVKLLDAARPTAKKPVKLPSFHEGSSAVAYIVNSHPASDLQ